MHPQKQNASLHPPLSIRTTYSYRTKRLSLTTYSSSAPLYPETNNKESRTRRSKANRKEDARSLAISPFSLSSQIDQTTQSGSALQIKYAIIPSLDQHDNKHIQNSQINRAPYIDSNSFSFPFILRTPQHRRRHTDAVLSLLSLASSR